MGPLAAVVAAAAMGIGADTNLMGRAWGGGRREGWEGHGAGEGGRELRMGGRREGDCGGWKGRGGK